MSDAYEKLKAEEEIKLTHLLNVRNNVLDTIKELGDITLDIDVSFDYYTSVIKATVALRTVINDKKGF